MADTTDEGVGRLASDSGGHIGDLARVGAGDVVNGDRVVANHLMGGFIIHYGHTKREDIINKVLCNWFMVAV